MSQRIDVIIPTYNGLPYLREAIASVLAQTHKDWRLYVIDDKSTDGGATARYVKGLKDSRITYAKNPRKGRSSARNHGIAISDSAYIAFLDSDDIWYPPKLQKQLELLIDQPLVGMVYGLCEVIDEKGKVHDRITDLRRGNLFKYLLRGNKISGGASIVMIRREVFDHLGTFREDFDMGEDWEMWLRIARSYMIDYSPEFLAAYRVFEAGSQPKFVVKAQGLEYDLPIMVKELKIGLLQRSRLAEACLSQACALYLDGGDRLAARKAFFRMLRYNPWAWITPNPRKLKVYLRLILGNPLLRSIRRRLSSNYRRREGSTDVTWGRHG